MRPVLFGILAGGRGRRMGGVAKGNLEYRGRPIVVATLAVCGEVARACGVALPRDPVALVGDSAAYVVGGVRRLVDTPTGIGPLGGLRALLSEARSEAADAIALAVDMPYLDARVLARLVTEQPDACALAPRDAERWQPLFARYRPARVLPVLDALLARGEASLQPIFAQLAEDACELALDAAERATLTDWDTPADMAETRASNGPHASSAARSKTET
jgi:molybdenum cofactor guanylyltransferase